MIAAPAPAGKAFDCSQRLTRETAAPLWALGYRAVGRYVPLPGNSASADIDARELAALTALGFSVFLVQHPRSPGWVIRDASGSRDAMTATAFAKAAGYPSRCHLYVDLEGISGTAEETRVYAESWLATVRVAGYAGGVYCGFDNPLSAQELWLLHNADSYWSSQGPRAVANRGFAIKQGAEHVVAGVRLDEDTIEPDLLGDLPIACGPDPDPVVSVVA